MVRWYLQAGYMTIRNVHISIHACNKPLFTKAEWQREQIDTVTCRQQPNSAWRVLENICGRQVSGAAGGRWIDWVRFNVPPNTLQVISGTVFYPNWQCQSTEGRTRLN